jgi:DNA-binding transcriptional LysR family regulator
MNLRFVEAFYWVATLRSISRAAEKLYLTQSAMSARIAALEDELGVLLLDRRDRSFRLTTAGSRFLKHSQKLLELQREAKAELGSEPAAATRLRIGAIESVLHSWLIPWLETLQQSGSRLELELTVETTPVLLDQMRRGALDVVFATLPIEADSIRSRTLPAMPMQFVGHAKNHTKRSYSLAEIATFDLMTFQRGSQPYAMLLEVLARQQAQPRKVHAVSSISAMAQLVASGFGIAALPEAAVRRLSLSQPLRILKCDVALADLPIYASYRHDPSAGDIEQIVRAASEYAQGLSGSKLVPRKVTASKKSMR